MRTLRQIVVLLLLGLVVAPLWASAQGHRFEHRSDLLDRLWRCPGGSAVAVDDEGCAIDPAGRCQAVLARDEGPAIDPDGLHGKAEALLASDAGPAIDPWGVAGR